MAGIKEPIQDILALLSTVDVKNQDNQTVKLNARVFNNQITRQREGKLEALPLPSAFLEIANDASYNRLLNAVSESDLVFRIYLTHWFTDAQDGTYAQDLLIFDLRDSIIALLSNYRPTACGNLCLTAEGQDYDHDNIYVYLLEFTAAFIDSKGSFYDIGRPEYQNSPPLGLGLVVEKVNSI